MVKLTSRSGVLIMISLTNAFLVLAIIWSTPLGLCRTNGTGCVTSSSYGSELLLLIALELAFVLGSVLSLIRDRQRRS